MVFIYMFILNVGLFFLSIPIPVFIPFGKPNRILVPAPMVFRHKTLHLTAELTGKENTSGNLQQ